MYSRTGGPHCPQRAPAKLRQLLFVSRITARRSWILPIKNQNGDAASHSLPHELTLRLPDELGRSEVADRNGHEGNETVTLQERLDAFKADFEANQAPAGAVEAFHRSTQELIDQRLADGALKVGDTAPEFTLRDPVGNAVWSRELLISGPLVLTFYRGVWCPYCNLELRALEEVVDEIRSLGAALLAISPQSPANGRKSARTNNLSFPILSDRNGDLAEKFGLRWTLQPYLIEVFKKFQVELPVYNDDDKWALPMPARYVIRRDGLIAYAEVNPDYTRRPEPRDMLPVLEQLASAAA